MAEKRSRSKDRSRRQRSKTIAFRLSDPELRMLEEEAAQLNQDSLHELARQMVLKTLNEAPQWNYLAACITELREDVATATEALLAKAGKVSSQEAHKWVAATFRAHAIDLESDQDRLA